MVLNASVGWHHLEGLLKTQMVGPHPQREAKPMSFPKGFPGDADVSVHIWRTIYMNVTMNAHVENISSPSISLSLSLKKRILPSATS